MDREKVIKSLKWFRDRDKWREGIMIHDDHAEVRKQICDNVIELLKEQEAVKPILIREGRNKYYNDYVCPRCDNEVVYEQNYCSECGVPFLWEGL